MKHYAPRDVVQLDKEGNYYCRHVSAMTTENLHSKSDIAAELAWRDNQIDELKEQLRKVTSREHPRMLPEHKINRFEVIDWTAGGEGRAYVKRVYVSQKFNISSSLQDSGRTVKVFLK